MFTKSSGLKIPDIDQEVLKHLYICNFDDQLAFEHIRSFQKARLEYAGTKLNTNVLDLLKNGIIYVCGRDKMLRPLVVLNVSVLLAMKPAPSTNDLTGAFVFFV